MQSSPLVGFYVYALIAQLVIIDPIGTAVLFLGLTPRSTPAERGSQARRASVIAFLVLVVFGLAGEALLRALGISLPALKVAGGILLFLSSADMVTAKGALRGAGEREAAVASGEDISVFPLAIPLIAGPGAMTTMVVLHSQAAGSWARVAMIQAALATSIGLTFVALSLARPLAKLLGATGANVIGRVLGVLVAALAAQIAIEGLRQMLHLG